MVLLVESGAMYSLVWVRVSNLRWDGDATQTQKLFCVMSDYILISNEYLRRGFFDHGRNHASDRGSSLSLLFSFHLCIIFCCTSPYSHNTHTQGIYPTALIVLVSFGRTHHSERTVARHEPLIRTQPKHGALDVSPSGAQPIHGIHEEQKLSLKGGGRYSDLESGEVRVNLRSFDSEAIVGTATVGDLVESQ